MILGVIFLLVASLVFGFLIFAPPRINAEAQEITIEPGMTAVQISSLLEERGIIRSGTTFLLYTYLTGSNDRLHAGTYEMSSSMNVSQVAGALVSGNTVNEDVEITIPEGYNVWDIEKKLISAGIVREGEFVKIARSAEGYLFPDTYKFKRTSSLDTIKDKLVNNFQSRVKDLPRAPKQDEIIMASILEKEARSTGDMQIVSGILWKRLRLGMALEADATAIYNYCFVKNARECVWSEIGAREAIAWDGSYNTYKNQGLPVGAISNPGLRAIQAAINPIETDYLYYLTTRDGEMIYSKTFEEHDRNREKYLK